MIWSFSPGGVPLLLPAGNAPAPALTFQSDPNTGVYMSKYTTTSLIPRPARFTGDGIRLGRDIVVFKGLAQFLREVNRNWPGILEIMVETPLTRGGPSAYARVRSQKTGAVWHIAFADASVMRDFLIDKRRVTW